MTEREQNDRLAECLRLPSGWKPSAYRGMRNAFDVRGDVTAIKLRFKEGELEALIDTADLPQLLPIATMWHPNYRWRTGVYEAVAGQVCGRTTLLHRVIMDCPPDKLVDHINHDPLDNRRCNLRIGNKALNAQNYGHLLSTNQSGYRGVSYSKDHRQWESFIHLNGKKVHLGYHPTAEEAAEKVSVARAATMPWSPEAAILAAVDGAR